MSKASYFAGEEGPEREKKEKKGFVKNEKSRIKHVGFWIHLQLACVALYSKQGNHGLLVVD